MIRARMAAMPLTLWRRHTATCPHRAKGRDYLKCTCPLWADGYLDGKRVLRKSLGTCDMARARKKAVMLEAPDTRIYKSIGDAKDAFMDKCKSDGLGDSTRRKYRNTLLHLEAFGESKGIDSVSDLTVEILDGFRASRKIAPITASKELQQLRQFCQFCVERRWMEKNPARSIKQPRNLKPNDVEPYTSQEVAAILGACDFIGQNAYERLRAKAIILTLRYTALRIGDVAMLERNRITKEGNYWRVFLRTEKNGKPVFLPIPEEMKAALDFLPIPQGTKGDSKHFFWSGISTPKSIKSMADRTLRSVFARSEVPRSHAHRFRHTLATELLGRGASFEEVADVLGNSPAVVRRHYAKWSPARQSRIDELMTSGWAQSGHTAKNRRQTITIQ